MITSYPRLGDSYQTANSLFDFQYPSGASKSTIESMIYNHFASYRLSLTDKSHWKTYFFAPRMNEIMPMFNKLYASADLILQPLNDINYSETRSYTETGSNNTDINTTLTTSRTDDVIASRETQDTNATSGYNNGNSNTTESGTNDNLNKFSDTPQGKVENLDDGYLTNVTNTEGTITSASAGSTKSSYVDSSNQTGTVNDDSNRTIAGSDTNVGDIDVTSGKTISETISYSGKKGNQSYAELLQKYRETIVDINSMLLNALADMFLQVYDWWEDEDGID